MADSEDMMDKTINAISTQIIAVVLLAQAFIPVAVSQIDNLKKMAEGQYASYVPYVEIIVIITIVSTVIGIIKMYTTNRR